VLPPAPDELLAPQPKQVLRTARFDQEFLWSPVAETEGYRLEIARDATFFDVVLETRTGPEPTARVTVLEPGTYFWRVSAVSSDGFEGPPSSESYFVFVETQP
jgi:hypothetical protein